MSLKSIFNTIKNEGYVIPVLDKHLLSLSATDDSRAIDVNAPSQSGVECLRARYYARTRTDEDNGFIEPRVRRIFDNGTKVHERLQAYLIEQGMLLMDEVPVLNIPYNIQGHTDGILKISPNERAVLEIKSINSNGFSALKDARIDHKKQGLVYLFCLETQRIFLRETYSDWDAFQDDVPLRMKLISQRYQHLKDGSKYSREEKINYQVRLHEKANAILYLTKTPITKVIFLYENKDTQDMKEFTVSSLTAESQNMSSNILKEFEILNKSVNNRELPDRLGESKSSNVCRWCNYKVECWG